MNENTITELIDQIKRMSSPLPLLHNCTAAAQYLGFQPRYFEKITKMPRFPGPVRPTGGDPFWRKSDLEDWVQRKAK